MNQAYKDELEKARADMAELIEKYSGLEPSDLLEVFATEVLAEGQPNE